MTAVIAVKYKDGLLVMSDSLALNVKEDRDLKNQYLIFDNLDKNRQKVFPISPYVVLSFTATNFDLDLMPSIANGLYETIKNAKTGLFNTVESIATQASQSLKKINRSDSTVNMIVVGYNLNDDLEPCETSMYYINSEYEVEEIAISHVGLGARKIIDEIIGEEGISLSNKDSFKTVNSKMYRIFDFCKEEENKIFRVTREHKWQIGGGLKRYRITKKGCELLKTEKYLSVDVKIGDVMSKGPL